MTIGGGDAQPALESWLVQRNTVTCRQLYCADDSPRPQRRNVCTRDLDCGGGTCMNPVGFLAVSPNFGRGAGGKESANVVITNNRIEAPRNAKSFGRDVV